MISKERGHMSELIALSVQVHLSCIALLVGLIIANLYLLSQKRTFFYLSKRLELLAPQYFIVLSAIFFTGLIVVAVRQFSLSATIWVMMGVWIILLFMGIKNYKVYKHLDKNNQLEQEKYKRFAFKKELLALMLIVLSSALIYGVR